MYLPQFYQIFYKHPVHVLPLVARLYDIKYYLENQVLPAVENIFQVFGISIKEVIEGKKQTTLGDFWGLFWKRRKRVINFVVVKEAKDL